MITRNSFSHRLQGILRLPQLPTGLVLLNPAGNQCLICHLPDNCRYPLRENHLGGGACVGCHTNDAKGEGLGSAAFLTQHRPPAMPSR